jgi:purine-binding chemotaxis protein CheW
VSASLPPNGEKGSQYLTFKLGEREYGIQLIRVREIVGLGDITPVPLAPAYLRGVITLRGRVVPVVDLRCKFGMPPTRDHYRKCIIVCDVEREHVSTPMSILVDAVSEVIRLDSSEIEAAPAFGTLADTPFIHGIAKGATGIKILLNIEVVLSAVSMAEPFADALAPLDGALVRPS